MADTNKVWLSGIAVSMPVLSSLPGKGLPFCSFELLVREDYRSKGKALSHPMRFRIEALGQQSDKVFEKVSVGKRYKVDGYLRTDDKGTAIRTFAVNDDESDEARAYEEGIRSALTVLLRSVDLRSATESIRLLLNNVKKG